MRIPKYLLVGGAIAIAIAATAAAAFGAGHRTSGRAVSGRQVQTTNELQLGLTPSSPQLAACMPAARLNATVRLSTDSRGFDQLGITARHLPPSTDFTVFLLEQAGSPFGAAQYIGDLSTDTTGSGHVRLKLIVQEAFASTVVNGNRIRVDLNRIGLWFADPAADDFCLGVGSPTTPFDGDNAAGVQAFNSANADPLPAP
jgi:hypothetical protein